MAEPKITPARSPATESVASPAGRAGMSASLDPNARLTPANDRLAGAPGLKGIRETSFLIRGENAVDRAVMVQSEWLLTDGAGGFAMGTASGIPTRRYHAWFIPALRSPVGRAVMLSSAVERLILHPDDPIRRRVLDLSSFHFPGGVTHPTGLQAVASFRKSATAEWTYRFNVDERTIEVVRELCLIAPGAASVRYRINAPETPARLELSPLLGLRDFHGLTSGRNGHEAKFAVSRAPRGPGSGMGSEEVVVRSPVSGNLAIPELRLALVACGGGVAAESVLEQGVGASFTESSHWWYDFEYDRDRQRGQDFKEDLFVPGVFRGDVGASSATIEFELLAWIGDRPIIRGHEAAESHRRRVAELARQTHAARGDAAVTDDAPDHALVALVTAADQFVVARAGDAPRSAGNSGRASDSGTSIIAGYPWFSDWGRDAMISLPGLLLSTRRYDEARQVLESFARLRRRGLIPNCFDNGTGEAEYNTVDASLWFIHAAARYAEESRDPTTAEGVLGSACLEIIDAYESGTDFNIRVDPSDGLVANGDASTQLTWMDARRDGVVFTPRAGKPVEINALWYNALMSASAMFERSRPQVSRDLRARADRVRDSFRVRFFDAYRQMCFDLVPGSFPGAASSGSGDPARQIRPNQIFAASLPYSPLDAEQRQAVLRTVRSTLLTPFGLRTLAASDPEYQPRYDGNLFTRDRAYHNGTVWPWLIGPYAEAVMRCGQFSEESKDEARQALTPLVTELLVPRAGRAAGQIAEIYDGEDSPVRPRRPDGCPAQAWSVAEVLRTWIMSEPGPGR